MNLATIIVLLIVLAMLIVAIRTLRNGKSSCSCDGKSKKTGNGDNCAGCTVDCPFRR